MQVHLQDPSSKLVQIFSTDNVSYWSAHPYLANLYAGLTAFFFAVPVAIAFLNNFTEQLRRESTANTLGGSLIQSIGDCGNRLQLVFDKHIPRGYEAVS